MRELSKKHKKKEKDSYLHKKDWAFLKRVALFIIVFALGVVIGYFYLKLSQDLSSELEKNIYIKFLSEIYEQVQENYWDEISDEQLSQLFKDGIESITKKPQTLKSNDKQGLILLLEEILQNLKEEEKKEFTIKLADLTLESLRPFGRSKLYDVKGVEDLKNMVENIDPETKRVEPTVFSKLIDSNIFYVHIKKFSPHTFDEFKMIADEVDNIEGLDSLILDLRDNIGGSIDLLPYFLGPFIGNNQYAYEWFRRGEYIPFKTKLGWLPSLVRYKKVVILINSNTQSTAEVVAATLKKYNVGVVVGTRTRGWGTVEKILPLDQQIDTEKNYSIFLVHSLTIRDDGQLIEGNGVEPVISINNPDWEKQLFSYFHYNKLIQAVKEVWNNPPFGSN
jgi:hypothetical protein